MQLAVHFWDYSLPGGPEAFPDLLVRTARTAEAVGFSNFTVMDHWFQMEAYGRTSEDPMLEGYTTLGFVAGQTERLRLGLMVTGVTYRHPGLLAKIVATLDVLSRGRAMLGIGAAWYEREHLGLGVPYPPTRERFERLEETLQICAQMWSDNNGPYEGRYYQLRETIGNPRPIQQPGPPVLIGGGGEQRTLRLVAQYANACNLFYGGDTDAVLHKLEVLKRHCDEVGRDYDAIEKTIMVSLDPFGDPDTFLRDMEVLAGAGVAKAWLLSFTGDPVGLVEQAGEQFVERLAQLG